MKDKIDVFENIDLKLVVVLSRMSGALTEGLFDSIKRIGLHPTEFALLEVIYHKGPQPIQKIGEKILITSGNMTYVADKLEKKGLVERQRHPKDRRITLLKLTKRGRDIMKETFPKHFEHIQAMMNGLTEAEKEVLLELSKKLGLSIAEKNSE
jgi:MarR family 2-MHQ and catechol resistance regulon transcriptional repressor